MISLHASHKKKTETNGLQFVYIAVVRSVCSMSTRVLISACVRPVADQEIEWSLGESLRARLGGKNELEAGFGFTHRAVLGEVLPKGP